MIIRSRPSGWRLFFVLTGSIVPKIAILLVGVMLVATIVTELQGVVFGYDLTLTPEPFTILGIALSIFLGFRNTVAYERYWEGRRLWGELLIDARILARQLVSLLPDDEPAALLRKAMVYKAIAFSHALRHHLRDSDAADELAPFLEPDEQARILSCAHRPTAILASLGADLRTCLALGLVAPATAVSIDRSLAGLDRVLGGCERIKSTPIPFSYTLLLHRTAYLYCFLLPFGLVGTVGVATPIVVGLVSYTFFGLDALGDEIEEPFGTSPNDLPLTALCRGIDIALRECLGETDLPPPMLPTAFTLQ